MAVPAGGEEDEVWARVRGMLRASGATDEEIEQARADDVVDLLLVDRLLVPADRRYTMGEVAAMTGMSAEVIGRLWRSIGLPEPAPGDRVLGDLDVEAVETFVDLLGLGAADLDTGVHLARVIGLAMARIADAELSATMSAFGAAIPGDSVSAADRFAEVADRSVPAVARLLEFVWRRHLQAATRRTMLVRGRSGGASPELTVGFADMVGFTSLSQQLDERQLAEVVSRFESVAHDTVTVLGGRVVKTIGDEVLFVADEPLAGARIGLRLAELYRDDDLLSDVRVGLAAGPVLVQDGDVYGPVVNLASRIVRIADPGTVLVADELRLLLEPGTGPAAAGDPGPEDPGPGELAFLALRPRVLKDVGRVQLWNLHRPGDDPSPADRRSGRRWQRWNEVLRDLDAARTRGERIVEEARRSAWSELAARARGASAHGSDGAEPSLGGPTPRPVEPRSAGSVVAPALTSGGEPDGGDAEGSQLEGPVDGGDGSAAQVDQPT